MMQCKRKVLARFPRAQLFEVIGGHFTIVPGDGTVRYLDIHSLEMWQGKTAAWRSAYFWCVRNPQARPVTKDEISDVIAGRVDIVGLLRDQCVA